MVLGRQDVEISNRLQLVPGIDHGAYKEAAVCVDGAIVEPHLLRLGVLVVVEHELDVVQGQLVAMLCAAQVQLGVSLFGASDEDAGHCGEAQHADRVVECDIAEIGVAGLGVGGVCGGGRVEYVAPVNSFLLNVDPVQSVGAIVVRWTFSQFAVAGNKRLE